MDRRGSHLISRRLIRFCGLLVLLLLGIGWLDYSQTGSPWLLPSCSAILEKPKTPLSTALNCSPLKPTAEVVHFLALGDNGSGTKDQYQVASTMGKQYQKTPYAWVLMLGDNIYETGDVKKLGESRFTRPYGPLLEKGVRFYPVLGNHDVLWGFTADQLKFFKMPGRYYTFLKGDIQFFALDTNHFDDVQAKWVAKNLAESVARWKIVYGHHPMFSSGLHGGSRDLQQKLKPLLEQYHVPLYLSGHDHEYERFRPVNGVTYIVSGGGGAYLRPFKWTTRGSLVRHITHHFIHFTESADRLQFEVIDKMGAVIDAGSIPQAAEALPLCASK